MDRFTHFVVHHSGGPRIQSFDEIRKFHMRPRVDGGKGFDDIGYHYLIDGHAELHIGRELPRKGAHAPPNDGRIGCCVTGNNAVPESSWVPAQIEMLQRVWLAFRLLMPWIELDGHRDLMRSGYTVCPGIDIRRLLLGPTRGA